MAQSGQLEDNDLIDCLRDPATTTGLRWSDVPIDLSRVSAAPGAPLIEPRDIYAALGKRPWPYLRLEQGEVLERWFERRTDRDVVIKQNTGGGKTVVGLLIAQSSLNEGVGPAAYLAPDSYLVEQVVKEANRLGLAVVTEPTAPAFISHDAILVTTFQRLVNGMSVFGVDGTSRPVVPLGTIVVDDAHAALTTVESQFSLTIPSSHSFYQEMMALFADDLRQQSESTLREIQESSPTALLRIPFWAWYDQQSQVIAALTPHSGEDEFKYQWPLIRDQFGIASATFTGRSLDIRPPAAPIHKIPAFVGADRRIYMTATLADDAILTQDLAVDPAYIATAVTPGRASDIGDRVILAPLELDSSLDPDSILEFARKYAKGWPDASGFQTRTPINVVVLVPSNRAAARWQPFADRVWSVGDLAAGVAELKSSHVGLVVLANKYDGIDLAGDACRLLIIDGLPIALDAVERREASALVKSHKVLSRQVQRVEQGMGRGVRDSSDYCAVLLLGVSLTRVIHDPKQRALFSPATEVQINLSRNLATQLTNGLADVGEAIDLCIGQDEEWVRRGREALATTNYRSASNLRDSVLATRMAFDRAIAHDFPSAGAITQKSADSNQDPAERGWLLEQAAVYKHVTDRSAAQKTLLSAMTFNHHVLHPLAGVSVERVRAAAQQAKAVGEYFEETFTDSLDAILGTRALFDELIWDKEHSDDAERMWEELGRLLGFGSERPEKRYGTGPDNLWVMSNGKDLVFDLKTGALDQPIKKSDVDQLGGHLRWHSDHYDQAPSVALLVHRSPEYDSRGTPPAGTRIFTKDGVERLREAVISLTVALPKSDWDNPTRIASELASRNLTADRLLDAFTVPIVESARHL